MRFVIFAHPSFLKSESMPRYARMLQDGLEEAGHTVSMMQPQPYFYRVLGQTRAAKWASYADQYLLFPFKVIAADLQIASDTLFIFADQALGPWVPYVRRHRKVVHCHDFLALKSALGHYPENPTRLSGRIYQKYIRWGFRKCQNFISISRRTAFELESVGGAKPRFSATIYNGLNYPFRPLAPPTIEQELSLAGLKFMSGHFLLFVGGEQWYKNRRGLLMIYKAYAEQESQPLPLVCVSPEPQGELAEFLRNMQSQPGSVHFLQHASPSLLQALYSGARLMMFPSLAEGFGWPLIEAQACGCPVLTTDDAPMNEIAGPVARFLPKLAADTDLASWATKGAAAIQAALTIPEAERQQVRERAIQWAAKFEQKSAQASYLAAYTKVAESPL